MTEAEWHSCGMEYDHQRLQAMLAFLQGKISDRKVRLFAWACCRPNRGLLRDNCRRHAVEGAEQFADRAAKRKQLHRALLNAETAQSQARRRDGWPSPGDHAHSAAVAVVSMRNNALWAANRAAID